MNEIWALHPRRALHGPARPLAGPAARARPDRWAIRSPWQRTPRGGKPPSCARPRPVRAPHPRATGPTPPAFAATPLQRPATPRPAGAVSPTGVVFTERALSTVSLWAQAVVGAPVAATARAGRGNRTSRAAVCAPSIPTVGCRGSPRPWTAGSTVRPPSPPPHPPTLLVLVAHMWQDQRGGGGCTVQVATTTDPPPTRAVTRHSSVGAR